MNKHRISWLLLSLCSILPFTANAKLFDKMATDDTHTPVLQLSSTQPEKAEVAITTNADKQTVEVTSTDVLAHYLDTTNTLSGDFQQIVYSQRGEQISQGTFKLKRPGMFDWQYHKPNEERIISDGKKVYHYDKDLEQITIRPRSELSGDIAMKLLVGKQKLNQSFTVKPQPAAKAPRYLRQNAIKGLNYYQLTPISKRDDIDQIWVGMYHGNIAVLYVDSGVGQQSLIALRNIKRNQNISNSSFHFTPPAGVDVIGG